MASIASPTPRDIEQYRQMRSHMGTFINRLVDEVPDQAWDDVTDALGLDPELVNENDHLHNTVADCCFFDWFDENQNMVERYADRHRPRRGTDEAIVVDAYLQAKYRILYPQSIVPGAGMYCRDGIDDEELFLIDLALSRHPDFKRVIYAARTIPFGAYWITTIAGIPVTRMKALKAVCIEFLRLKRKLPENLSQSILLVRRFLEDNMGHTVMIREDPSLPWRDPLRAPAKVDHRISPSRL